MDYTFETYLNYNPVDRISTEGFKNISGGIIRAIQTIWKLICGLFTRLKDFLRRFFTKKKKPTTLEEVKTAEQNITRVASNITDEKFTQTKEKLDRSIERAEKQQEENQSKSTSPSAIKEMTDTIDKLDTLYLSLSKHEADIILQRINAKVNASVEFINNNCDDYNKVYPKYQKTISDAANADNEIDANRIIDDISFILTIDSHYASFINDSELRFARDDSDYKKNVFHNNNDEINVQAEKLAKHARTPAMKEYIRPQIMKMHDKVEKLFKLCENYKNSMISLANTADKIKFDKPKSIANRLLTEPTKRFEENCNLLSSLMTTLMKCVDTVNNAEDA